MPVYHTLGKLPRKRHQVFRQSSGELYSEELMGNMGFTGPASLLYHVHRPTEIGEVRQLKSTALEAACPEPARHRHFRTAGLPRTRSAVADRIGLLFNQDVRIALAKPTEAVSEFYRNSQADEVVYVSEGSGTLESTFGKIPFRAGDYLVIPRGIIHRYEFDAAAPVLLAIESSGFVRTPKRYRNEYGQLLEHAPYSERDIRKPVELETHDEKGEFRVLTKKSDVLVELEYRHHPFDAAGWDGFYYPWAISIHDFEPRVGRFHLPPPMHQTFEGDGFVVCSFCPRPYDFDPEAVPAPYSHSNVMSDEVLYYANSEFMSRTGIEYGSITLHPDGLAHGPQPGRAEKSIGQTETNELAVMLDTFRSLNVAKPSLEIEDRDYYRSWLSE
jgi:homogentisate 1,2-dioxygenase